MVADIVQQQVEVAADHQVGAEECPEQPPAYGTAALHDILDSSWGPGGGGAEGLKVGVLHRGYRQQMGLHDIHSMAHMSPRMSTAQ